ncbi:MAG: histidine phosphatase family protein [Clostridium sp.]|nr:histidine phosphatase family protein [Clostridium sp.]
MSLYFLRHLKTNYNRDNIISGKENSEILSGQKIINLPTTDIKFDVVLSSPLKRCHSTLSLISKDYMLSIKYMNALSERDMGVLEGISRAEAKIKYPSLFCGSKINVLADIPDGESIYEVQKRLEVIANYINANQDKNILICSHNQTMKILYFTLNGILVTNDVWQCINFPNGVMINVSDCMNLQI